MRHTAYMCHYNTPNAYQNYDTTEQEIQNQRNYCQFTNILFSIWTMT